MLTLAPGQSGRLTFAPPRGLPVMGPWHARVALVSGLTQVTARATVMFKGASAADPLLAQSLWGGTGIVLVAAAGALLRRRRRAYARV